VSLTLSLGVLDVPYNDAATGAFGETTGDVAEILEKNYGVMAAFFESRKEKIAQWLADDMANSIQALVNGGRTINAGSRSSSAKSIVSGMKYAVSGEQSGTLTYGADQKIEAEFRAFIFGGEMEKIQGAISAAAQAGKTKRTKSGYTKGKKARPFAVDTGLYVSAFRAWTAET
jgi:hypothetical protein